MRRHVRVFSEVFYVRFCEAGGEFVERKVESFSELQGYDVIVNCTGLGARQLCSDRRLLAVRGQAFKVSAVLRKFRHGSSRLYENLMSIETETGSDLVQLCRRVLIE